jgi:hypothetical protein
MFRAIFKTFVSVDLGFDGPRVLFETLGHELVYEQRYSATNSRLKATNAASNRCMKPSGGTGANIAPISRC